MKNAQNSLLRLGGIREILQGIYQEKQKLAELTLARYQNYKNAHLKFVTRKTKISGANVNKL